MLTKKFNRAEQNRILTANLKNSSAVTLLRFWSE